MGWYFQWEVVFLDLGRKEYVNIDRFVGVCVFLRVGGQQGDEDYVGRFFLFIYLQIFFLVGVRVIC